MRDNSGGRNSFWRCFFIRTLLYVSSSAVQFKVKHCGGKKKSIKTVYYLCFSCHFGCENKPKTTTFNKVPAEISLIFCFNIKRLFGCIRICNQRKSIRKTRHSSCCITGTSSSVTVSSCVEWSALPAGAARWGEPPVKVWSPTICLQCGLGGKITTLGRISAVRMRGPCNHYSPSFL